MGETTGVLNEGGNILLQPLLPELSPAHSYVFLSIWDPEVCITVSYWIASCTKWEFKEKKKKASKNNQKSQLPMYYLLHYNLSKAKQCMQDKLWALDLHFSLNFVKMSANKKFPKYMALIIHTHAELWAPSVTLRNQRLHVWSIMGGFRSYQCIYYLGQSHSLRVTWFAQHSAHSKTLTCSQDMPQHDAYFMNVCKVLKNSERDALEVQMWFSLWNAVYFSGLWFSCYSKATKIGR